MKRHTRKHMKLADLIAIVSKLSRNDHETSAIVADLFNRGLIKLGGAMRHHKVIIR